MFGYMSHKAKLVDGPYNGQSLQVFVSCDCIVVSAEANSKLVYENATLKIPDKPGWHLYNKDDSQANCFAYIREIL